MIRIGLGTSSPNGRNNLLEDSVVIVPEFFWGEKNAQDAQETNQHSYPGTPWISIATVCLQGMLNWLHHNTGYNTEQNISPRASQRDDINPRFADCIANSCICFSSQTKSLAYSIRSRIPFYGRLFCFLTDIQRAVQMYQPVPLQWRVFPSPTRWYPWEVGLSHQSYKRHKL